MEYRVSSSSIAVIAVLMVLGAIIPLTLFFLLNRSKHASPRAFVAGWLAFLISANILERLFHTLVFSSSAGAVIQKNLYLYALYGGITAGLFEELARYFMFSRFLRNDMNNDWNALMYGAGHGGSEMFNGFSVLMANNLIHAAAINTNGGSEILGQLSGDMLVQMQTIFSQLTTSSPMLYLLSFAERLTALAIQLALSVLVFYAVKNPSRNRRLLLIAVELHALVDFVAVIASALVPTWATELIVLAVGIVIILFARMVWKQNHEVAAD